MLANMKFVCINKWSSFVQYGGINVYVEVLYVKSETLVVKEE